MKKVILSLAFALTLISSSASLAKSQPAAPGVSAEMDLDVNIYVEPDALKLNVGVIKEAGTRVRVKLIDPNGISILYHRLNTNEVSTHTRLDLSSLENGRYALIITNGETEEVKDFQIITSPANSNVRGILLNQE